MLFFRVECRNVNCQRVNSGIILNGLHDRLIQVIHSTQANSTGRTNNEDQTNFVLHRVEIGSYPGEVLIDDVIVWSVGLKCLVVRALRRTRG